jgi:maltooligosyltrehalose trehalohydrolase
MSLQSELKIGAEALQGERCSFLVWAPFANTMEVHVLSPDERTFSLEKLDRGYHHTIADRIRPGSRYLYKLDGGRELPDPASRFQPAGIHGPSQVASSNSLRRVDWRGLPLEEYVTYELHVGTYTPEGTLDAIVPHLRELSELGVTAVELMPVAQFPGNRNWGYDSVYPFAVQNSYGGPDALRRLVDACHGHGFAVILDVVYNHLGPEGNYLGDFGPYFTERYHTPWGPALNFDGPFSDEVRRYFKENALYWVSNFRIDALRLDAVHAIVDVSAQPFLQELAYAVHRWAEDNKRRVYLIAESDLNDSKLVHQTELGGYGLDAVWNDDFHHALHVMLTGEDQGYYEDFGAVSQLKKAFDEGFVYNGQYSQYRHRKQGNSSKKVPADKFIVFDQNHDQVGNRMLGERLSQLVPFEKRKLAAGITILSPFLPLLFMGEEYGEEAPFLYFVSHSDPQLIESVQRGRKEEFSAFAWEGEPPNPQDEATFQRSKLNHDLRSRGEHRSLLEFYKHTILLRRKIPALARLSKERAEAVTYENEKLLCIRRWANDSEVFAVFNFSEGERSIPLQIPTGVWRKELDSADKQWNGPGSQVPETVDSQGEITLALNPMAFALFRRMN